MSIDSLSPRGRQLAGGLAKNLELIKEHEKEHRDEVLVIAIFLLAHIRATWPQALAALKETL